MRFSEIVNVLVEGTEQTDALLNTLAFLKKKAEREGSNGEFKMDSIINQVKSAGAESFVYDNFVDAYEGNDAVKNLVDNYNEEYVTLKLGSANKVGGGGEQDKAADVSKLAQQAVSL